MREIFSACSATPLRTLRLGFWRQLKTSYNVEVAERDWQMDIAEVRQGQRLSASASYAEFVLERSGQ